MAEFTQKQPQRRREEEQGDSFAPIPSGQPSPRPSVSQDSDKTLSDIDQALAENEAATSSQPSRVYDEETGSTTPGFLSGSSLKDAEESEAAAGSSKKGGAGGDNPVQNLLGAEKQGAAPTPFEYTGGGKGALDKAKGLFKKHKRKFIAGGITGVAASPLIMMATLLFPGLKLPFFANNEGRRLTKIARQYQQTTKSIMAEKVAYDSLTSEEKARVNERYKNVSSKTLNPISKLNFNKVVENLHTNERMRFNYQNGRLVSITFAPETDITKKTTLPVPQGRFDRILHPYRTFQQNRAISQAFRGAMKSNDSKIPIVIRSGHVKNLMERLKVNLGGVDAERYKGKDDAESKAILQKESYDTVHDTDGVNAASNDASREAARQVAEAQEACVNDEKCLQGMVERGDSISPGAASLIQSGLQTSTMRDLVRRLGTANAAVDVSVIVCNAYDASRLAADAINSLSDSKIRAGMLVMSTAAQQEKGTTMTTEALNAMNWKLGDVSNTNIIKSAEGKSVDTIKNSFGSQRTTMGTFGQFSIFDVLLGSVGAGMNQYASTLCPIVTNIWVGAGLGIGSLLADAIIGFFTGGTGTGAKVAAEKLSTEAVKKLLREAVQRFVDKAVASFTTKQGLKRFFGQGGLFVGKQAVYIGADAGITYLARQQVASHSGAFTSGLELSTAFGDNADEGIDLFTNEDSRGQFYGRTLTAAETAQNDQADMDEYARIEQQKSPFERYLAISNPNSLVSRMAITTGSMVNYGAFGSLLNNITAAFNPFGLAKNVFGSLNQRAAVADNGIAFHYGNVQSGYSNEEERLLNNDDTYTPSENELILFNSGKEQEIADKYEKCFTEDMGSLLERGDIKRNEQGETLNEGDCSPLQLGPHNPQYGDLVFRWRVSKNIQKGLETLNGVENPAAGNSTGDTQSDATLRWPFADGTQTVMTSCFGPRSSGFHEGLDIIRTGSTPGDIVAAADGIVKKVGGTSGYGPHYVVIQHTTGANGIGTGYGHMSSHTVREGLQVKKGQIIGKEGAVGNASGPHLHFNVYRGENSGISNNINPLTVVNPPAGTGGNCSKTPEKMP